MDIQYYLERISNAYADVALSVSVNGPRLNDLKHEKKAMCCMYQRNIGFCMKFWDARSRMLFPVRSL